LPQQRDLRRADLADRDIPAPDVGARVDRILGEAPVVKILLAEQPLGAACPSTAGTPSPASSELPRI